MEVSDPLLDKNHEQPSLHGILEYIDISGKTRIRHIKGFFSNTCLPLGFILVEKKSMHQM
jgi:hypothetical protein